jgi:hypothetical protein
MKYEMQQIKEALSIVHIKTKKQQEIEKALNKIQPLTLEQMKKALEDMPYSGHKNVSSININGNKLTVLLKNNVPYTFEVHEYSLIRCIQHNLILDLDNAVYFAFYRAQSLK